MKLDDNIACMVDRQVLERALIDTLIEERTQLEEQLKELGTSDRSKGDFDPNFADSSQVTAERGEIEALRLSLQERLKDVDHALKKVSQDNYGLCETCGAEIAIERLEAMPTARYCMTCATAAKGSHR